MIHTFAGPAPGLRRDSNWRERMFEMLEQFKPQLAHNIAEYRRLSRIQMSTMLVGPVVLVMLAIIAVVLGQTRLFDKLLIPIFLVGAGVLAIAEVRKVLVFRRDLHERRAR